MDQTDDERVIVSYLTLRRIVGVLGCALPIVVAAWAPFDPECQALHVGTSISQYYDCRPRDAFVGILFAIAWFMFSYRGYDKRDERAGTAACFFALGVALFPHNGMGFSPYVHYACAGALLLTLAYFSYKLFTLSSGEMTEQKKLRNQLYRACGVVILVCVALAGAVNVFQLSEAHRPVFWLEAIALWAFGISWFVKGNTILKDAPSRSTPNRQQ